MKGPTILYDAHVLYLHPTPLRDFLARIAMEGLMQALGSDCFPPLLPKM